MDLSVIAPPIGVVVAAAISALAIRRSKRSDDNAAHVAAIETQTGMAGLVIAGWQNLVAEGRVTLTAVTAERDQLRVDLNACIEKARRRR